MPFPGLLPVPWPSLNLLKVPLKPPDFKNVSKASSVAPIRKPLGQGRTFFFQTTVRFQMWHKLKNICSRVELWRPLITSFTPGCPLGPLK